MYQRAKNVDGGDYKVGDVVQIPLADVDTAKVDSKCITAVVVEVLNMTVIELLASRVW
jgi:hypothetical protein